MRVLNTAFLIVLLSACGSSSSNDDPPADVQVELDLPEDSAGNVDVEFDVGNEDLEIAEEDTKAPEAELEDDPLAAQCAAMCAKFVDCPLLTAELCSEKCLASPGEGCDFQCLSSFSESNTNNCSGVEWCLDMDLPGPDFKEGPYGNKYRDRAGPLVLATMAGTWSLEEEWTGNDSYIFFFTKQGLEYPEKLWAEDGLAAWMSGSPGNAHFFFLSYDENAAEVIAATQLKVAAVLGAMSETKQCHWNKRIHYVTQHPTTIEGWFKENLANKGVFALAVDRLQHIRQVGSMSSVLNNWQPSIANINYEVQFYNFEYERAQKLAAETVTEVVALDKFETGSITIDVEFPEKAVMAGFDTLVVELGEYCKDFDDDNCAEWDTGASLTVCHQKVVAENPYAETACQPKVTPEEGGEGTPAETKSCECKAPDGSVEASTHTCNGEGTGFGECSCPCKNEVARWITTYHREGRWLTDISPFLPNFNQGGTVRMSLSPGHKYVIDLKFRLSNTGKAEKPSELVYLYDGGGFNLNYNSKYEPKTVAIPADVKRVELVTLITGHGWGKELANCAEFCLHTHHFTINGKQYMRKHNDHYGPGKPTGCAKNVKNGVVPNQYGTWPLGRAGWCPGFDVKPWVKDVSSSIKAGEDATISYKGLFLGKDYEPKPSKDPNPQGFGANIWMNSWLVYYR